MYKLYFKSFIKIVFMEITTTGYKGSLCEIDCNCNGHGNCATDSNKCVCDKGYIYANNTCQADCSIKLNQIEWDHLKYFICVRANITNHMI